jgi:hypothetical protein
MGERYAGQLEERENLQAVAIVVGDAEQPGVGIEWCDLVADGADALAALLETGDGAMVEGVRERARALGFVGWARALDAASKERSPR